MNIMLVTRFTLAAICVGTVLIGTLPIEAQKRPVRKAAAKPVTAKPSTVEEPTTDLATPVEPDSSEVMGAPYRTGDLPSAAPIPAGTVEEQAAVLAEAITAGDSNSVPALMAALKAAGYGLRGKGGDVDYDASRFQGLALDAWQIALITKLYGDGWGAGLGRFGESMEKISPSWKKDTNVSDLVESIRAASTSEKPATKFWALLIIELGNYAEEPYDLRLDSDVKKARLDALQMSLILTRLGADMNYAANRRSQGTGVIAEFQKRIRGSEPRRIGASFAPEPAESTATDDALPCTKSELEQLVLDLNATGAGLIFGKFIEHLEDGNVIGKAPGQMLGAANAALILLKLIMTYAALEADIAMDGGMLTRTKTTLAGEKKGLSAKVKLDIGKWQVVNCLRATANRAGIDFSLPGDGPIAGVRVDWNLLEGGRTHANLKEASRGRTVTSDQIVYLDTTSTAEPADRNKHYNYTDKDGVSKVFAVGMGQPVDLSGKPTRPVMKRMTVDLDIQVKTMKVKDATTGVGTANDIAGNALAFLTGDMLGGVTGTVAETIYRTNLGSSRAHSFPVKDWVPCDGGWRGTVTYQRVLFNIAEASNSTQNTTIRKRLFIDKDHYSARISIAPGDKAEIMKAVAQISYTRDAFRHYVVSNESTCGNRGRRARWWSTEISQEKWSGSLSTDAQVMLSYYNGKYAMSVMLPGLEVDYKSIGNSTDQGGCGTPKPPTNTKDERKVLEGSTGNRVEDMKFDPKNPHVLKGSQFFPGDHGRGLLITWDLARCM
jgi:hypothetical protein